MLPRKRDWAFALFWINLAPTLVVFILFAANQITAGRELLHTLAYALVYSNLTGILGLVTMAMLAGATAGRPRLVALLALALLVVTPVGCLLAQTLLMVAGFMVPNNFWLEYVHTLRIAIPLGIVFGTGAMVHATLRERVEQTEKQLHEKEIAEERERKLVTEARLRSLEARIHPHFLFNTLNSISSLIAVDPKRAEHIVGRLAALLRASLDNSNQPLIPLQQELAMVDSYLDIERSRFGEKLRGAIHVPGDLRSAQVPPMSVQTLVENAVKHGVTPQSGSGEVSVTACAIHGDLHIEVRDTGPGFDLTAVPAGHGLDNLVERLDALFGAKARLNTLRKDGHCVVEMVVPQT